MDIPTNSESESTQILCSPDLAIQLGSFSRLEYLVNYVGAVAGGILLISSWLKYRAGPIEGYGLQVHLLLVSTEIIFGILLIAKIGGRRTLLLAMVLFGVFSVVALLKTINGEQSCGCFGNLSVPPWITLILDIVLIFILVIALRSKSLIIRKAPGWRIAFSSVLILSSLSFAVLTSLDRDPAKSEKIDWNSLGTISSNLVVLEPEKWVGKPLPVASLLDGGSVILKDDWIVLMVHEGCSTCEEAIPKYRAKFAAHHDGHPKIALIEIPPSNHRISQDWATYSGILPENREWFATTPVICAIKQGIVIQVFSGEEGIDPDKVLQSLKK